MSLESTLAMASIDRDCWKSSPNYFQMLPKKRAKAVLN